MLYFMNFVRPGKYWPQDTQSWIQINELSPFRWLRVNAFGPADRRYVISAYVGNVKVREM